MSNRREFIQAAGIAATGLLVTAAPPAVAAAPSPEGSSSTTKSAANNPMPRDVRSKLTDTDPYTERAKKYGVR